MITLKLLLNSRFNPDLSAYTYLFLPYGFNKSPMAPPGTCVIVHDKRSNRISWGHYVAKCWCISPSLNHYKCMQCYMPATGIVEITDILEYIPKAFAFPKTSIEDYLQQSIGDMILIMKDPPKTITFLYYVYAKKKRNQ